MYGFSCKRVWKVHWYVFRWQLALNPKKLPLVKLWYSSKGEFSQLSESSIKVSPFSSNVSLWGHFFFMYPNQTTYCNRLNDVADTKIKLASFDSDIKRICKTVKKNNKTPLFSPILILQNMVIIFMLKVMFVSYYPVYMNEIF